MKHKRQNLYRKITPIASAIALAFSGAATSANELALEEIVVTAQKRSESLQDIPATVNVLDGDVLKDFNANRFADLESLTAGLQITSLSGRSGRMTLRGIPHTPVSAAEGAVTTYWNQAIVDSNAVYQQMFDVERIEILRGPQGTLAGRTSPAGAINIHLARPNLEESEGNFRTSFTDNNGVNTQLAASVPLIPGKLAVRVAGLFDESDLNEIENIVNGEMSHEQTNAARISVSWLPADNLSVDLAVQTMDRDFNDVSALSGALNPVSGTSGTSAPPPIAAQLDPGSKLKALGDFDRRGASVGIDGKESTTQAEFLNSSLVVEWDLESHTVTSVTGYHETDSILTYDQTVGSANPGYATRRDSLDDRTDWSQEIRITSQTDGNWEYMLGAYYESSDVLYSQDNHLREGLPAALAYGSQLLSFPVDVERSGLFTHNKFHLSDKLNLQLGLRYQEVETDRDLFVSTGSEGLKMGPTSQALPANKKIKQVLSAGNKQLKEDSVTGQVTLQYSVSDDLDVYGLVSTGWRPGGITITSKVLPEDVLLFGSEDSVSYELGFKSVLMDGAMRLSGAVFYSDFTDYINRVGAINVRDDDGVVGRTGFTINGDAQVSGAELEMQANLNQNWSLGGNIAYSNSEYADGTMGPCNKIVDGKLVPEGQSFATCDLGGTSIGRMAPWTGSFNSEYRVQFDNFVGYGRLLYSYVGDQEGGDIDELSSYNTFDAYIGIRNEQFTIELFARNLLDEEGLVTGAKSTPPVAIAGEAYLTGYANRYPINSRRVGINVSYSW